MKMRVKVTVAVVLVLSTVLLLTGCGKQGIDLVGKWDNADLFSKELFAEFTSLGIKAPEDQWLEFTKDGKLEFMADGKPLKEYIRSTMEGVVTKEEDKAALQAVLETLPDFTYKVVGDKVELHFGEDVENMTAKQEGDKVTLSDSNGNASVFTKHKTK